MPAKLISAFEKLSRTRSLHPCVLSARKSQVLNGGTGWMKHHSCQGSKSCRMGLPVHIKIREIQTTDPRKALPPIFVLLLRPLSKILAILTGRLIRKWWSKLTPEEKEIIWESLRKKRKIILGFGSVAAILFALYYENHLTETPITKRRRFIMLDGDIIKRVSDYSYELQMHEYRKDLVPHNHPFYQRSFRVTSTLLSANKDIPEVKSKDWSLYVIDRPDIFNSFCFPDGKIFIFTGILNFCTNDDQLAVVLSHEISHTILSHVAENLSKEILLDALILIPCIISWAIFANVWAFFSDWATETLSNLFVRLPYSRTIEKEADVVGLILAARSCYDVREAPVFWSKMNIITKTSHVPEWLSSHPSEENREEDLRRTLPLALKIREESNCPNLKWMPFKLSLWPW